MDLGRVLKIGTEVRLKGERLVCTATLHKITEGCPDTITVLITKEDDQHIVVFKGDKFSISLVTDRGLLMLEAKIIDIEETGKSIIVEFETHGGHSCLQRREAFRVREKIEINARKRNEGPGAHGKWVRTSTVDISETGMLVRFDEFCSVGQLMEFAIKIKMFDIDEAFPVIKGRVVRCIATKKKDNKYLLGVSFVDLPEKCRSVLIRLVVLSQRSQLTYKYMKEYGQHGHGGTQR